MARSSHAKRLWYRWVQWTCRIVTPALLQLRCRGRERVPKSGGVLVVANHQSHLDPLLIGMACDRPLKALARKTLFRSAPLRWIIESLETIPIDRDGMGVAGLKETLRCLKREEVVLLFPEGTRSQDGEIGALKPGFCALARRGRVAIVPVALDGAFEAWPRSQPLPRRACIHIEFGEAMTAEQIAAWDDTALLAEVERRLGACHARARASRLRAARS